MLQALDNLFGSSVDLLQRVQLTLILGSLDSEIQMCLTWAEQRKRITFLVIIYPDNENVSYIYTYILMKIHLYILQEITVFNSILDSVRKWMFRSFQMYYLESKKMFIVNLKNISHIEKLFTRKN